MKHIDDLFRDGLGGRKGDVPADLWNKIQAAKPAAPVGEAFDGLFADALRHREAPVPIGMWGRISAARALPRRRALYAAGALMLLLLLSTAVFFVNHRNNTLDLDHPNLEETELDKTANDEPIASVIEEASTVIPPSDNTASQVNPINNATRINTANRLNRALNAGAVERSSGETSRSVPAVNVEESTPAESSSEIISTGVAPKTLPPSPAAADRLPRTTYTVETLPNRNATVVFPLTANPTLLPDFQKGKYRQKPSKTTSFSRAPRHRTQTEMLFGAAYANQNLMAATPSDRQLLAARENSEFPELSFQVTLRQSYKLTDRLTLTGGLTYVDIRNQFDFEEVINGDLQLTRKNNHIRMLEVPMLAGLTLPGRRFNVALNAGPVFNLTTSVQGNFLDPDAPEPLSLSDDGNYRTYTGVGYMTSLTTTYAIGKKDPFVLVLEPFFKHYPGSFTRSDSRIRESYWLAGLQLGVRKGL